MDVNLIGDVGSKQLECPFGFKADLHARPEGPCLMWLMGWHGTEYQKCPCEYGNFENGVTPPPTWHQILKSIRMLAAIFYYWYN